MKKNLLTIAFLISGSLLFSQARFGVKAGANLVNIESKDAATDAGVVPSPITSFHFGGFAELGLNTKYFFQPGLSVGGKGYKINYSASESGYDVELKSKATILYIDAPLNLIGKFDAAPGYFILGGGPYVGYALSGKNRGHFKVDGPGTQEDVSTPTDAKLKFGNGEEEIKQMDFGVNLLAGYELKNGRFFTLGYGLGLNNLSNTEGESARNSVIAFSFGFKL